MEPGNGKEMKETVPYLPICPHLHPSGGAHRAEQKGEGFVCSTSTRFLSTLPDRRICCVPAAPSSTSPACKTFGTGPCLLSAPRRAEPRRPLLCATLPPHRCSLNPSFLPLPLPPTVLSFFYLTPHSFILPSSALSSSLCPSPCASLSRFYSPSQYLPPLIFVLLPCRPSPASPPSPAGVSVRGTHWLPAPGTGAALPLPEPADGGGCAGHSRGAVGLRGRASRIRLP